VTDLEFIPAARPLIGDEERAAVDAVLQSGMLAQGPEVAAFEREFSDALVAGRPTAAVNSGTSGLHLGLLAAGIGPGDEVIVPSFTFAATANAVVLAGAVPVFADIEPDSFNLDPDSVARAIGPNTAAIMSSVPASERGAASGIRATFTNAGMSLSIGIFFSLMIAGLAKTLPGTLSAGLQQQGVSVTDAHRIAELPPVGSLFAAFLGYNPIGELMGDTLQQPGVNASVLTGKEFFPHLISGPFHSGLTVVFVAAAAMMLIGAAASWVNPGRVVDRD